MVLAIYGASGLGREVLELAEIINDRETKWENIIFIDDGEVPSKVNEIEVYKYNDAKLKYKSNFEVAMAVGELSTREKLFNKINNDKIGFASLIHPDIHIPSTTVIGKGVVIQYGCFISCNVIIEDYVFIQPHVNIGHDDIIKEGAMIAGFSNIGGIVSVGKYTYIGLSTSVKQSIKIGDYSIVGMSSAVCRDIEDGVVAMGNPARTIKKNEERHIFK